VGKEHDAKPAEHSVEGSIRKVELFSVHSTHTRTPTPTLSFLVRGFDHAVRQVNTDSLTRCSDALNGWEEDGTPTSRYVEHTLPRLDSDDLHEALPKVGKCALRIEVSSHSIEAGRRLRLPRQGIVAHRASFRNVLGSLLIACSEEA